MQFHFAEPGSLVTACGLKIAPYRGMVGLTLSRVYESWDCVTCHSCLARRKTCTPEAVATELEKVK